MRRDAARAGGAGGAGAREDVGPPGRRLLPHGPTTQSDTVLRVPGFYAAAPVRGQLSLKPRTPATLQKLNTLRCALNFLMKPKKLVESSR